MERNGRPLRYYVLRVGRQYRVIQRTDSEIVDEGLESHLVGMPLHGLSDAAAMIRALLEMEATSS